MKDLVIVGTGGFAREVHQVVEDINKEKATWNFLGFLDVPENVGMEVHSCPVLGDIDWLAQYGDVQVAIGIGSTPRKRKVYHEIKQCTSAGLATLVHPLAWIGNRVELGAGTIVCAGASITTDIAISDNVIINLDCTIGHDVMIDNFVTISPSSNISGAVTIGQGCDIGTSSTIIQGISIGSWSIVGAGSVVVKDVPCNVTVVGIPAKVIKEREAGWYDFS